jgi:hypothetical protein
MSRKASSHLEAVADRDPFEKRGRRTTRPRMGNVPSVTAFRGHGADDPTIDVKISECSDLGIPSFAQTANDGPL